MATCKPFQIICNSIITRVYNCNREEFTRTFVVICFRAFCVFSASAIASRHWNIEGISFCSDAICFEALQCSFKHLQSRHVIGLPSLQWSLTYQKPVARDSYLWGICVLALRCRSDCCQEYNHRKEETLHSASLSQFYSCFLSYRVWDWSQQVAVTPFAILISLG